MKIAARSRAAASITLAALGLWLLPCRDRQEEVRYPPVALRGTEMRTITSSSIDQEYTLHINLPASYRDSKRIFPVVYVLDSDAYFGYFRSLAGSLHYGHLIPEIIVVGVAYGEDSASAMRKRERDLLPALVPNRPGSGHAESFLRFLQEELVPFVESHYRADSRDRTIAGMSAGATFAAYALFASPGLFHRYIIISPYLIFGQEVVLELEKEYARRHQVLPVHVYTAMGELEPAYARGPWNALVDNVKRRNYADLKLTQELFAGLSHMDVVFSAFVNGVKVVYSGRSKVIPAVSDHYPACPGTYQLNPDRIRFTVRLENGRLFISRSGEFWDELTPVSDTRFEVEGHAEVQFSFVTDGDGAAVRMIVHQLGMDVPAEKID